MSDRDKICEELSAYLDGELPDEQVRRIEQALRYDPALARELEQLRATRALVRAAPRQRAPDDFVARVLAQAERSHLVGPGPTVESPGVLRWARHFATAAMLLIALGIGGIIVYTLWNTRQMPPTPISMGNGDLKSGLSGRFEKDATKDGEKLGGGAGYKYGKDGEPPGGGRGGVVGKGGDLVKSKGYADYDEGNLVSVDRLMVNVADPDKDVAQFARVLDNNNFKRADDLNARNYMLKAATNATAQNTQNTLARNTLPPQGYYYVEQLNNDQVAMVVNGVQDGREAHNLKESLNNTIQEQRIRQPRNNWDEVAQLDLRNQAAVADQKLGDQRKAENLDDILQDAVNKRTEELAKIQAPSGHGVMSQAGPIKAPSTPPAPAVGPAPGPVEGKYKQDGERPTALPAAKPAAGGKFGPADRQEAGPGEMPGATARPAQTGVQVRGQQAPLAPASQPAVEGQMTQQRYAGQVPAYQNSRAFVIILNRAIGAEAARASTTAVDSAPASQVAK
ncbi:MAG: anti-sigma factor [Phycisphaerae bacterium]